MRKLFKCASALLLATALCLTSPSIAFAAETVNSFEELTSLFRAKALARNLKFSVHCTMPQDEIDKHVFGENSTDFWDGMISMMDDPNTTDDADYIVGNLSWTNSNCLTGDNDGNINFNPSFFETLPQTQYVNTHVPEILSSLGIANMATNYEKVKAIHDWVCKKITYTSNGTDIVSTCYGAITDGKVLCNGYSLCLYKLLVSAGIPCKYIGGIAGTGRDANGHAWNIVALGDKWYYVDCTWDDEEGSRFNYDYFLKGSRDFDSADPTQPHKLDPGYTTFFAKAFPMAATSFNPTMMDSTNYSVQIGSEFPKELSGGTTDPGNTTNPEPTTDGQYSLDDIVEMTYPISTKFKVKRNKTKYIMVFINKEAENLVDYVNYRFISGKGNVKKVKNHGFDYDDEEESLYTLLTLKGKKKGKVKLNIILTLSNGQEIEVPFSGTVK